MLGNLARRIERLERRKAVSTLARAEEIGRDSYMRDPVEFSRIAFQPSRSKGRKSNDYT